MKKFLVLIFALLFAANSVNAQQNLTNFESFWQRCASGKMAGCAVFNLRARNPSQDTTPNTIWTINGTNYAPLIAGVAMEVVSSSANDAAAGTGARTVQVTGIKGDYTRFTETITLNGVTPVPLVNTSAIAINRLKVLTAGSGLVNAGTVDVRTVSGSTIKRRINSSATAGLGYGQSSDFLFTVPAGYTGILRDVQITTSGTTGDLTAWIISYDSAGVINNEGACKSSLYVTAFNGGQCTIYFGNGLRVAEKTLIEARSVVSAGTSTVMAMGEILIMDTETAKVYGF